MNPLAQNGIHDLGRRLGDVESRLETVEEREESTRRRVDEGRKEMADVVRELTAIRMDVHGIRTQKKTLIGVVLVIGAGLMATITWAIEHRMIDVLTRHGILEVRAKGGP